VKVFILLGESNMVGAGQKRGKVEGTLEYTVMNEMKFTHLVDSNQEWRTRPDVRYVAVKNDMNVERNEWLGPSSDHFFFGPELQLGYILGELYEEPVLLLKAASGHHSLGGDLLPPGSPEHKYGEWIYPGYGGTPRRWPYYADPTPQTTWYAGHAYDTTISNIQSILERIGDFYPRAIDYKIEGIAIWQGDSDQRDSAYSSMYQRNLRNLIASLRIDLQAPNAKVAIASIGQKGQAMDGNALEVYESQMLMGSLYEDFQGNVMSIDIRSSWRGPFLPGHYGNSSMMDTAHYGNNAETVMEVGNALGLALAKLLHGVA
jgi:Carbohydrate esterase, sialic acid-specific acetylesterase